MRKVISGLLVTLLLVTTGSTVYAENAKKTTTSNGFKVLLRSSEPIEPDPW